MDLYEACENGNEERVVEMLVYGEDWHGLRQRVKPHRHGSRAVADDGAHSATSLPADAIKATATTLATTAAASAGILLSPLGMLRARGTAGRTPLLAACMGGQVGVIRLLLGESCEVYFTSRTREETEELLQPLVEEYKGFVKTHAPSATAEELFVVTMVTKDGGTDHVPMATVRFPPARCIPPQDLLEGVMHVDDFGNTPLQCISCFGCGSSEKHIDDGLEITRTLLIHGDQPNLPKIANQWTPLHWAAYNGNHEQCAVLLDPPAFLDADNTSHRIGKTQFSIPLMVNSDNLFAADVAGRRGLAVANEMAVIHRVDDAERNEYARWRLRLDHVDVLRLFTSEFIANTSESLVAYVNEMNARLPLAMLDSSGQKRRRRRRFTCADAIRYGQHLLYWMGCFGLVDQVRALLELELFVPKNDIGSLDTATTSATASTEQPFVAVHLRPLYVCSCEENKRQSVLHAVAVHGQEEIVQLLLGQMLYEQQHPLSAAQIKSPSSVLQHKPTTRAIAKKMNNASVAPDNNVTTQELEAVPTSSTRLDVLPLVDSGWRNFRRESPLFLAVLYLQDDVVAVFDSFLSDASVQWERTNCNVEGSFIHHVASDAARRVLKLGDHTATPRIEYVLLFDGLHKRQFKESVIESMREESVLSPSLEVAHAGVKTTSPSLCGLLPGSRVDYVVVGATDAVLVKHAQALQLKIKHRGSAVRSKYNAATPQLFEPFRSLQRQQVVLDIIQKNVNLKKHLKKRNLRAIFPLHDASGCKNIMRHWALSEERRRLFQPFVGSSLSQFLLESRTHQYEMLWPVLTYFGEKHAFYYAFMLFDTVWLLLIAVPGVVCQLLWSLGSHRAYVAPLFSIYVSVWATLFVERWKRKRSEIQSNFGNFKRNRNEQAPEFYGDFQVQSPEKPVVDTTFPKSLQLFRIYVGLPLLLTLASFAVAIFIGVKLSSSSNAILETVFPWMPFRLVSYVVPVLNAVSMLVLDNVYTQAAVALTQWENHRTVWQFESMLATKLFWFKFLNAFLSLFWVAFVDRDPTALRKQLVIIMGARQIWYAIQRSFLPLVQVAHAWKRDGFVLGDSEPNEAKGSDELAQHRRRQQSWFAVSHEWYYAELPDTGKKNDGTATPSHAPPPPIVRLQELMQPTDFLMGKQMEVVLQFGYITMFVSVLPMAPLLALVSNVVSTRLDVVCCTQAKRRPPFESETEVATFMSILEFMSFAGVAVNCAVLFLTTNDDFESLLRIASATFDDAKRSSFYVDKLWVLLAIEHAVLGLKALLSLTIDDAATWVQNDEDRQDDEVKQHYAQVSQLGALNAGARSARVGDTCAPPKSSGPVARQESTAINRVLKDKYDAAVKQRDAANERERQLQRQLDEVMKKLAESTGAKFEATYAALINDGGLAVPTEMPARTAAITISNRCVVCLLLRRASPAPVAQKRCIACRYGFCEACDDVVHLDDLGVREPKHCRVSIPVSTVPSEEDEASISDIEEHAVPYQYEDGDELLELLKSYISLESLRHNDGGDVSSLRRRCHGHEGVIMRYISNVHRRWQHNTRLARRLTENVAV